MLNKNFLPKSCRMAMPARPMSFGRGKPGEDLCLISPKEMPDLQWTAFDKNRNKL
jgi:hypothetical protein